ncbi:MAG: hypothetical protein PF501_15765 [Salinisphaera sp.]|nr:hypothetical protein [Salinisphaera sp.]
MSNSRNTNKRKGQAASQALIDPSTLPSTLLRGVTMLDPRVMVRNPVMFVTEIGAVLTTLYLIAALLGDASSAGSTAYRVVLAFMLWATVYLANIAEALAEARGKAQAQNLRGARQDLQARRLPANGGYRDAAQAEEAPAAALQPGDRIVVDAGELIAADGDVVEGIASVDESAITGESAPVIREAGGDRSAVTGGDRRHPRAFGLDRGRSHHQAGRIFPRSHDFDGRRRGSPENAQ